MTWKQRIKNLFETGVFSTTAKLMMVLYYWILGGITDADAAELFLDCGFTFTKPTATGAIILTDETTNYTIVSLITAYHNNDYSNSYIVPYQIIDAINDIHSDGYITDQEQTDLIGLGWN